MNATPPGTLDVAPSPFEVFFDADCPLCMREIRMLRRLDEAGRIRFTDITSPQFDASALGLDQATLMATIHGRLANGQLVRGVEVFRQLYAAVGFRRAVALSRVPGVSHLLDLAYAVFAKNRLRLTGRCVDGACDVRRAGALG
jgi:predicted DCC family thiol-disulfide oxidoreductase YuxK